MLIKPASGLCNFRCRYCFYADVTNLREVKSYGIMTPQTQEAMIEKAFSEAKESVSFAFQGGEPTLAGLDYYKRHIELCNIYNKKHIRVFHSIQTNGYLIDEEWADFFYRNQFLVGVSLDGPKEIHDAYRVGSNGRGTFADVMRAISILKKKHVEFNILCVVTNFAAKNATKLLKFFLNNEFGYLQFIPCLDPFENVDPAESSLSVENYSKFLVTSFRFYYENNRSGKQLSIRNFDNYLSLLLGYPAENCGMNGVCNAYFVIEGDGSVFPCDFYVLDRYRMGNVHSDKLSEMLKGEVASAFVRESYPVSEECTSCKWFRLCRGGCRRYREPFADGLPQLNCVCESYRHFFEICFPQLEEMARNIAMNHR